MRKLRRSKFPWRQEGNQEMGLSERRGEKTTVSSRTHCGTKTEKMRTKKSPLSSPGYTGSIWKRVEHNWDEGMHRTTVRRISLCRGECSEHLGSEAEKEKGGPYGDQLGSSKVFKAKGHQSKRGIYIEEKRKKMMRATEQRGKTKLLRRRGRTGYRGLVGEQPSEKPCTVSTSLF